jgi:hypothetical protein
MRSIILLLAIAPSTALADYTLDGTNRTASHDCGKDDEVKIRGGGNTLTVTGTCKKVMVQGIGNKLTIAATARLSIMGDSNTAAVDAADEISVHGTDNQVTYVRTLGRATLKRKVHGNSRVEQAGAGGGASAPAPAPAPTAQPPASSAPSADRRFTGGTGQTVSHDCGRGGKVQIEISSSKITLTGACSKVELAGSKNTIAIASTGELWVGGTENRGTLDAVDAITTGGNRNALTYRRTVSLKAPKLSLLGKDNSVTLAP